MSQDGTIDKRQHRRLMARIPVRFGTEGRMCEGMIIDISEGGLQVRSTEMFAAGVVVDVFVQFPRRRLRLRTRVAWVRDEPPTMGLSFIQRDRSLMAAYDQWVEETRGQAGAGPEDEAGAGGPGGSPAPPAPPSAPVAEFSLAAVGEESLAAWKTDVDLGDHLFVHGRGHLSAAAASCRSWSTSGRSRPRRCCRCRTCTPSSARRRASASATST